MTRGVRRLVLRAAVSLSLLVLLGVFLDPGEVLGRLAQLRPGWVVAALAVSVLQVALSAWRWRFTAARLGIGLPLRRAVGEYYLATFLNQVLPGGVLGDVSRAWRHARSPGPAKGLSPIGSRSPGRDGPHTGGGRVTDGPTPSLRSVHAVILERASGQVVMTGVAVLSAALLLFPRTSATRALLPANPLAGMSTPVIVAAVAITALVGCGLLWLLVRRMTRLPALHRFLEHARVALLGSALPVQAAASLLIVGSYVAVFAMAARAVGVTTPLPALVPLVPPILVTMLVPVSVAGWGVREGAAAILWGAVGLTVAEGVAISVSYGLLVFVSSLPGAVVLLATLRLHRGRDRRGDRSRAGSAAPEA